MQSIVSMVAPQLHNVDIEDMAPNSGATIQKGLRKVAVYKDEAGKKHAFSALCPHLGCLLQVSGSPGSHGSKPCHATLDGSHVKDPSPPVPFALILWKSCRLCLSIPSAC